MIFLLFLLDFQFFKHWNAEEESANKKQKQKQRERENSNNNNNKTGFASTIK